MSVNQSGVSNIAGSLLPIDAINQFSIVTTSSPEIGLPAVVRQLSREQEGSHGKASIPQEIHRDKS